MDRTNPPADASSAPAVEDGTSAAPHVSGPPRRDIVAGVLALICGAVCGLFPALAGIPVLLNPLRKKAGKSGGAKSLRVATVDSLPADGKPVAVPVLADKVDAWTREAGQPIGAVFLRKVGNSVECFNAICPHAGCMVAFSGERNVFQCPCHTSSFQTDGARIMPSPSPRDMDKLVVDAEKLKQGEIWVEFVNYYPGKADQEAKG